MWERSGYNYYTMFVSLWTTFRSYFWKISSESGLHCGDNDYLCFAKSLRKPFQDSKCGVWVIAIFVENVFHYALTNRNSGRYYYIVLIAERAYGYDISHASCEVFRFSPWLTCPGGCSYLILLAVLPCRHP